MKFFNVLTKLNKRSLASKYLHFHCPTIFPIYDSIAKKGLKKLDIRIDNHNYSGDNEYTLFCNKILELKEILSKAHLKPSLREIDNFLLKLGGY
jgi:hypothetical protein